MPVIVELQVLRRRTIHALINDYPFSGFGGPETMQLNIVGIVDPKYRCVQRDFPVRIGFDDGLQFDLNRIRFV